MPPSSHQWKISSMSYCYTVVHCHMYRAVTNTCGPLHIIWQLSLLRTVPNEKLVARNQSFPPSGSLQKCVTLREFLTLCVRDDAYASLGSEKRTLLVLFVLRCILVVILLQIVESGAHMFILNQSKNGLAKLFTIVNNSCHLISVITTLHASFNLTLPIKTQNSRPRLHTCSSKIVAVLEVGSVSLTALELKVP